MGRLFSGTKWDRPPSCERCGKLEAECTCPPAPPTPPVRLEPSTQTARIRVEKRPKGKLATIISGLDPQAIDLNSLCTRLKNTCGSGGTTKDGIIEIQGDHRVRVEQDLLTQGFKVRRS